MQTCGGYGDPLKRPVQLVAIYVRRQLVSFAGAKRYGVIVNEDFTVNESATEVLREKIRKARPLGWEKQIFDRGGTMEEIRAKSLEETGLPPPRHPWETRPRGPMSGQPYVREWYEKQKAQKEH